MTRLLALFCGLAAAQGSIKAHIHREAAVWEPVGVKAGGAVPARTSFSWRLRKSKKKTLVGQTSKAKAFARLYKVKDDTQLVVSVFPEALAAQGTHVELRFLLVEGFLEELSVKAVTASSGGPEDDARALQAKGLSFQEESPASGSLSVAALDARPGKASVNAGSLKLAAFADPGLGFVSLSYSARGVAAPR